jgi:septum formation protein
MPNKNATAPQLILASGSPRRCEILDQLGIRYRVIPAALIETPEKNESPEDYVRRIAAEKSLKVQMDTPSQLPVLAADTEVVLDGEIFGKPQNRAHGLAMLASLSGREHKVLTAISFRHQNYHWQALSTNLIRFREINPTEIEAYWLTGEPHDKAGAYAIQGKGSLFIEQLCGSYSGVMGLPVLETSRLLSKANIFPL